MPRVCSQNSMSVCVYVWRGACVFTWLGSCVSVGHTGHSAEWPVSQTVSQMIPIGALVWFSQWVRTKSKTKKIEKRTNWKIYLCLNKHFRNALQSRSAVSSGRTDVHPHLQPGWQFTFALRHLATSPKCVHVRKCPVRCMQIILYCRLQDYVLHN